MKEIAITSPGHQAPLKNFLLLLTILTITTFVYLFSYTCMSLQSGSVYPVAEQQSDDYSSDQLVVEIDTENEDSTQFDNKTVKLFCMILTTPKSFRNKTKLILNTWASKCDRHRFVSTIPAKFTSKIDPGRLNKSAGIELRVGDLNLLQPPNYYNESYEKLTDKVVGSYRYVYEKYPGYDFYLKCDDDTFIFVDNLRAFLRDKSPSKPATFGYDFESKNVDFGSFFFRIFFSLLF
jgi:hypothetical protein